MALLCNLMVMLIASIISIVLLLISYFLIIIFGFRLKNNPYELMTASPRWIKVLSSVFVLTGASLAVGALVISLRKIEDPITPGILITGDTVGVIGLLFLYFFTIQFEAIKGDSVYIRRFIKVKEIKIKDIAFISTVYSGYVIGCKNGTCFSISATTLKVQELIKMIDGRMKSDKLLDSTQPVSEDEESSQESSFAKIGKEVRNVIPSMKKNLLIIMICVAAFSLVITGLLVVLAIVRADKALFIVSMICGIVFAMMAFLILPKMKKQYEKDLTQTDEYLGRKYLLLSKDVKGSAKRRFKNNLVSCIICAICGLFLAVLTGLISSFQKPVEEASLVMVSGDFEYVRRVSDDYAIGLKNNPIEYRISSIEMKELDMSFKQELNEGDTVYFYIDSTRDNRSLKYQDKTYWNYAYIFKTDTKTYLSYEGYVRATERNARLGFIICYVSSGVAALSLCVIPLAYAKYKSDSKKERIEL